LEKKEEEYDNEEEY
jgi:hypothetical protein